MATCCYCQARVIISVAAGSRHELTCTSCGAPLQQTELLALKSTEKPASAPVKRYKDHKAPGRGKYASKHTAHKPHKWRQPEKKSSKHKHRSKKPRGLRYWVHKAIDELEDIFD